MKQWVLLALVLASTGAEAFPPPNEPTSHVIFSENRQFKACVSAWRGTTIIKRVHKWWPDELLWSVKQHFDYATLSNDGQFLFTSRSLFMMPRRMEEQQVIWVYLSDGSTKVYSLNHLVHDKGNLKGNEVMGMTLYDWGNITGIDGGWILIETCEHRNLRLNVWTGEVRVCKKKK